MYLELLAPTPRTVGVFGAVIIGLLAARLFLAYRRVISGVNNQPGFRVLFGFNSFIAYILPEIPFITTGIAHDFRHKHKTFKRIGQDVCSIVSIFPWPKAELVLADVKLIKEVTSDRYRFPKPLQEVQSFNVFGGNIGVYEGEEWKRQKKAVSPAFSERNNVLVWDETVRILMELFEDVWGDKDKILIGHVLDITFPLALKVIGAAGFGQKNSWQDNDTVPPGHKMSFNQSLGIVSKDIILKAVLPNWFLGLTKNLRSVRLAFDEFNRYLLEMVRERRNHEMKLEKRDLFSNLLEANEGSLSANGVSLSDSEVIGNIFLFLFAGHETTAHTLGFSLGLLAVYQDEQEKLYRHVKSIIPEKRAPNYGEMPLLTYTLAVLNETLRKYPLASVYKTSVEDTTLTTTNHAGDQVVIPVPKGTNIILNPSGVHYNSKYWEDPEDFRPERFLKQWPRDAFLPFSAGARGCLGRKFFETEAVAALSMLVMRYKIDVMPEFKAKHAGRTLLQMEQSLIVVGKNITLRPDNLPLVLTRRD